MLGLIVSLIAVVIISLICAFFCHLFIKQARAATIAAVVYSVLFFQALSYLEAGSLDPYWLISTLVIVMLATPIAILIGTLFTARRQRKAAQAD